MIVILKAVDEPILFGHGVFRLFSRETKELGAENFSHRHIAI